MNRRREQGIGNRLGRNSGTAKQNVLLKANRPRRAIVLLRIGDIRAGQHQRAIGSMVLTVPHGEERLLVV